MQRREKKPEILNLEHGRNENWNPSAAYLKGKKQWVEVWKIKGNSRKVWNLYLLNLLSSDIGGGKRRN